VASPLPSQDSEPTYLDFFGMARAPFCKLSAPSELFYSDQCSLLNSHLTGATEQPGSLIVVCGADGSGKTTLLNQYLAGLGDDLCHATFDETCVEGTQFYCSFLAQIGFGEISGTLHELRRITREYLIHQRRRGEHVLFFMDNTQLMRPAVLEQLRWIAEINIDNERVLSVVLAGNLNLPRILDSPAMRSLNFRYHTNFHIRAYSEIETDDYVRHHLTLAGAADAAKFSDESRALIYRFTGGIPRTINRLCNAVLTESCVQGTRVINEERIRSVAAARRILPHAAPINGKGRRKTDLDLSLSLLMPDIYAGERMAVQQPHATFSNAESWKSSLRHDVELNELLSQVAELSAQLEAAGNLAQALDDKAKAIGQLNAALSDSEKRRHDAEANAQSMAKHMDALLETLDASNKEVEALTARQTKCDDTLDQLTQALAESKVTLAERSETVEKLAANLDKWESSKSDEVITDFQARLAAQATELNGLLTAVASRAAEIANLKEALSDGRKALLQSEESSKHLVGELETERGLTKLANTMLGETQKRLEVLERNNSELQASVEHLNADLEVSAKKVGKIDALEKLLEHSRDEYATLRSQLGALPLEKKAISHSTKRESVSANGNAATIELFLGGKLVKSMDLAGGSSRILIGRAPDCELHLNNKFVSRHHALISCTSGRIAIEDLHSSNGIHVNSRKVGHSDLRPGDTVAIGDFRLRLKRG
jgi:type II secretory pathway predicted ATPase ExeA